MQPLWPAADSAACRCALIAHSTPQLMRRPAHRRAAAAPRPNALARGEHGFAVQPSCRGAGGRRRGPATRLQGVIPAKVSDVLASGHPLPAPASGPQPRSPASTAGAQQASRDVPAARRARAASLTDTQLLRYERRGYLVTHGLLPADVVGPLKSACEAAVSRRKLQALRHRIRVLCPGVDPSAVTDEAAAMRLLRQRGTDALGFLQFFHLHRESEAVRKVALGLELGRTAAQLLGVPSVRVYQDCLFLKEPGYAETNWHSDLRMAPFDTNHFITAWLPLRPIPSDAGASTSSASTSGSSCSVNSSGSDGAGSSSSGRGAKGAAGRGQQATGSSSSARRRDSGLMFAAGSHRDFALPFWHEMDGRDLSDRGYPVEDTGSMQPGDVSWHHGWTLHCAAPQPRGTPPRLALAVSFFADGARLLPRRRGGGGGDSSVRTHMLHDEDAESYQDWVGELKDGAVARHRLLPLVWPQQLQGESAPR